MRALLAVAALLFSLPCGAQPAPASSGLSQDQVKQIGRLIYLAECQGNPIELTSWEKREDFPSLGIGHFIWYTSRRWGYDESFPPLVTFLEAHGVPMPGWTKGICPWNDKAAFDADLQGPRLTALRKIFLATFDLQTQFIMERRAQALPAMLSALPPGQRAEIQRRFDALNATPMGAYATIDYVNFKGEGLKPEERYHGEGWGLLQVLQNMDPSSGKTATAAFADSCMKVLTRRVQNAPPGKQQNAERSFLRGWMVRCDEYRLSSLDQVEACKAHGSACPLTRP